MVFFTPRLRESVRDQATRDYEKARRESENIGSATAPHEQAPTRDQEMQRQANKKQYQALQAISDLNRKRLIQTGQYAKIKEKFNKIQSSAEI